MSSHLTHRLFCILALLALVFQPLSAIAVAAPPGDAPDPFATGIHPVDPSHPGLLFRALIPVKSDHDLARIRAKGALVLRTIGEGEARTVFVLVDGDQLAELVRLGYRPQAADELRLLATAQGREKAWLARSLAPLLQKADALAAVRERHAASADAPGDAAVAASSPEAVEALSELRSSLAAMTVEQQAGIADSVSVDDDADGLTNTQESWWCTDPLNPNSDGDSNGYTDGQEVSALLDFTLARSVRWGYGAPFGPPNAWPNFNDRDGSHAKVCNDGDYDTIPDYAEAYMVGTRTPAESTDNDKFDDGQELFGVTFCPGGDASCGYGAYPRPEYWNYIKATMPNWVRAPGDNPFVAAFPIPEVNVDEGTWKVDRVTTITTQQGQMTQTTKTYGSESRKGQKSSVADTQTWNEWEEVSQGIERPMASAAGVEAVAGRKPKFTTIASRALKATNDIPELSGQNIGSIAGGVICGLSGVGAVAIPLCSLAGAVVGTVAEKAINHFLGGDKDQTQIQNTYNDNSVTQIQKNDFESDPDSEGLASAVGGLQYSINQQGQMVAQGFHSMSLAMDRQTAVLDQGLANVANAILTPRVTETHTNGKSWGGSQTVTNEEYEEHALTEQDAFTSGENWSTAWAVDSSHAADLTFSYRITNSGTEYAREITGLIFNVYLDGELIKSYPAWQQFPNGKLENLFPDSAPVVLQSNPIPLTLKQMEQMDTGAKLQIIVEDYSYGADELFYEDANAGGMTVYIEDGVADGDENVDMYVIPTWQPESVQDLLSRYFPAEFDAEGRLSGLWTPEFNGANPPVFHEHYLSNLEWWNIYSTQPELADLELRDLSAQAGQSMLIRISRDSDRDGYQDRVELVYGTDKDDLASHPVPEVLAGYVVALNGNQATVTIALENNGTYDAYGVQASMVSPDDTTTVTDNIVGGNGRVRGGRHVAVGAEVQAPSLTNWSSSTADPYSGGDYTGPDRTFTFTVSTPGRVGSGSTTITWTDNTGGNGQLAVGSSYHAPLPLPVRDGFVVGFDTGDLAANNSFTVAALSPQDTLRYTINTTDPGNPASYVAPVIVISYNDPQGNHLFATAAKLNTLSDSLAAHSAQMLKPFQFAIQTVAPVSAADPNLTSFLFNNPSPVTISGAQLQLDFITDGVRVLHQTLAADLLPGPNLIDVQWQTSQFSQPHDPTKANVLIAHLTDSESNSIATAARPLSLFAREVRPALAMRAEDATWNFGEAKQGTLLRRSITFGNTGAADLLTYVSAPAGISVPQTGSRIVGPADTATYTMTLNTAALPLGPYAGTITVRTSDPAKPAQTVQVTGNVTAGAADTPVGALQRPLDVSATVSGNLGEWKEYSHNLGPEPQTLHPVKVYSQDYQKFWGVGKHATVFSEGTAAGSVFGNGRDGPLVLAGGEARSISPAVAVAASGTTAYPANSTGFLVGDEVLFHQTQRTGNVGRWELNRIVAINSGTNWTLEKPLERSYDNTNGRAQVVRVPNYTDVTVPAGSALVAPAWDGAIGGILVFRASGSVSVQGRVDVSEAGFRAGGGGPNYNDRQGRQGESYNGAGGATTSANAGGGGGGQGDPNPHPSGPEGAGGGGGGYGANGANGSKGHDDVPPGQGGVAYGSSYPTELHFGSGGGGGGADSDPGISPYGGSGARGGGLAVIYARTFSVSGLVLANGGNGLKGGKCSGAGGGGAGGSVFVTVGSGQSSGAINALGGTGGDADYSPGYADGDGGSGAVGRVHIRYCNGFSGSSNPSGAREPISCYIAEQVESAPYANGRLNLPEAGTRTYQVQYGLKLNYAGVDNQTPSLRVPAGVFSSITLQALVSDMPSNGNVTVDVGNDDVDLWTLPVTNGGQYTSANLAPSFNAYWASHGASTSGTIDVPVKVTLDRAGQVFLTNVQATLTGSKMRVLRLPVQPSGYANVTANLTISGGSGPLSLAADVGDNGTIDWTSNTTPASYPVSLTTSNLASAINAYLSGKTGEPEVPIRFHLAPFATLDMTGFSATPTGQADGQLAAADVSFSAGSPTEGDPVTVTALVHNPGSLPTGPVAVSFHATSGEWGEWSIGSAFVPDVPAGGTAQAQIEWNTLGFTGDTPVRLSVDPYGRLPESNEGNNEATKNLTIKTRPDLRVKQIDLSNPEPMAGESVTVKVTLRNSGQTDAAGSRVVLYDSNPDSGGTQLAETTVVVAAGAETVVELPWNPTVAGEHKLFARSDLDRQINESDEANNDGWRDVYAGLASPLLIDSGAGSAYDPTYTPELGFGYLGGQDAGCGADLASTQRSSGASDTLQYRFDHLLPGHFYHLDLTLSECDGLGRQEMITIDDNVINDGVTLTAGTPSRLSFRLDPAFYTDRSITVSVRELSGYDALIAEVNLYDIDYRYSDGGHSSNNLDPYDPIYPAAPPGRPERKYGWLDGQMNQPTGWGTLPYQTRRIDLGDTDPSDDPDKELRYRFDGLRSTLHYQLHMSFWIKTGSTVKHNIGVDDIGTGVTVETVAGQPPSNIVVDVQPGAYTGDGSIVVKITRAEAGVTAGAFVNEIALEELTLLPDGDDIVSQDIPLHTGTPNWFSFNVKPPVRPAASCTGVTATTAFTTLYGDAVLGSGPVPVGALVEAFNPSGVKTGCFKLNTDGKYGYMRVYGAEGSTLGMAAGDPIILKVNGIAATPTPYPLVWQDDKATREVDLDAPDVIPVETLLAPIMDKVIKLQCENGTYLPPPADPRFNTCTTVEPGRMYLIWVNAAADLTVTGNRVAADRPLVVHSGYNWLGYLPTCELTVATALGGIAGEYDLLYSESATYRPPPAEPIYNTFSSMAPGRGYMSHMTEATTLTYPAGLCGGAK